nr:hypothetical protein [Candidatus Gracilibacteria bacterium]
MKFNNLELSASDKRDWLEYRLNNLDISAKIKLSQTEIRELMHQNCGEVFSEQFAPFQAGILDNVLYYFDQISNLCEFELVPSPLNRLDYRAELVKILADEKGIQVNSPSQDAIYKLLQK